MALARSIEMRSETEPYIPNSTIEPDRIRCAQPHHATARNLGVLNPGEQQQQPEQCLDVDRDQEQGVDVEIHRGPIHRCRRRFNSGRPWLDH